MESYPTWMRRIVGTMALVGALWGLSAANATVRAADEYSEDTVKAAFLYRFAGYVSWPQELPTGVPFTIAALGSSGTVGALERLLPNHPIKNHPAQVRLIKGIKDLGDAQLLYVAPGQPQGMRAALQALSGQPVLIVTDEDRGLEAGSIVNFLLVDRRVRFEVSLSAAEEHGLKISSELLSVAARVQGGRLRSDASCGPLNRTEPPCPLRVAAALVREYPFSSEYRVSATAPSRQGQLLAMSFP